VSVTGTHVSRPGRRPRPANAVRARRSHRWARLGGLLAIGVAIAFLGVPALAGVPARLVKGCGEWIATAGILELLSFFGFVVFCKLVFAAPVSWRRSVAAGLRALGASTILPAGGLIGPSMGAWSATSERPSLSQLTRATVAFVILTSAPAVFALGALGAVLWLGLASGPHDVELTLLPASLAIGVIAATALAARPARRTRSAAPRAGVSLALAKAGRPLRDGITDAKQLVGAGDWKLTGSLAYSAFDFAVLWAAFHAYGHTPPFAVIGMGYLVGSLAGALPVPAGVGAVDGGLIGALVLYGAPLAPAAAAVLLYRGISLALPIALGAMACLSSPRGRSPVVDRRHRASPALPRVERRAAADLFAASAES
jgi:uncharacterized membrane protein YbhN (UPF0104 family)